MLFVVNIGEKLWHNSLTLNSICDIIPFWIEINNIVGDDRK